MNTPPKPTVSLDARPQTMPDPARAGGDWSRRRFLGTTAAAGGLLAVASAPVRLTAAPGSEVLSKSATELGRMIRERKISSSELVDLCLRQIEAVNPKINAVVALCADRARAEAKAADAKTANGQSLGPLHGVPFTIKDSLETEGVVSTAGSLGLKSFVPKKDATVVARLRRGGLLPDWVCISASRVRIRLKRSVAEPYSTLRPSKETRKVPLA